MGVEVIIDMSDVSAELAKMEKDVDKEGKRALQAAGNIIKEAVQQEAPVRTGRLKRGIRSVVRKSKEYGGAYYVRVYPHDRHHVARFLEHGTVKMRANPFFSRGYEKSKGRALAALQSGMRNGLGL